MPEFHEILNSPDYPVYVRNASKNLGIPEEELANPESEFTRDYINVFYLANGNRRPLNQIKSRNVKPFLEKYTPSKIVL